MHIYAFGSVCRGEVDASSDVDMLAIVGGRDSRFNPQDYSVYSYSRIKELWEEGNPFAWHLYLESKLIFASDNNDYLRDLGKPKSYTSGVSDCEKFREIFSSAKQSIEISPFAEIFDLSSVFLAVRNFATCYSLHHHMNPDFSRNSARNIGEYSIPIDVGIYYLLERARILCTRGFGELLTPDEVRKAQLALVEIDTWMKELLSKIENGNYERI